MKAKVLNNKGYAEWWLGEAQKARESFKAALDINPEFKDAQVNLELIQKGHGPQNVTLGE